MDKLTLIINLCAKYIVDPNCVYDMYNSYLIVMKRLSSTTTNEGCTVTVDVEHAQFIASELEVVQILDTHNVCDIINTYDKYTVGKTVVSDKFNKYMINQCTVYYFKSIQAALTHNKQLTNYYQNSDSDSISSIWSKWHDNGQKYSEGEHVGGKKRGRWTNWFDNGQLYSKGEYIDGQKTGIWLRWYNSGQKRSDGQYINGVKIGVWTYWYANGQKKLTGEYIDGKESGRWQSWHINGQNESNGEYISGYMSGHWSKWHDNGVKNSEGVYVDGKRVGSWSERYDNSQRRSKGRYVDGKRMGSWTEWHKNGHILHEGEYDDLKGLLVTNGQVSGYWSNNSRYT